MLRLLPAVALFCAGVLPAALPAGGGPVAQTPATDTTAAPAELARTGWESLELGASSLLGSAVSRLRLYSEPAATLDPTLQPGDGHLLVLLADSRVAGNRERRSVWFDPDRGLVQRCRVGFGRSDSRAKCYRYEARSIQRERRESDLTAAAIDARPDWTRDGARSALALARDWPVSSAGRLSLPDAIPEAAGLVSPTLLLPLASAADLRTVSDSHVFHVHTDHDFFRVTLRISSREPIEADYRLESTQGERQVQERIEALVIRMQVTPLGRPEDGFELLGLRPPLTLLLDPATRLPLALRGDAPRLGPGEVRLQAARLIE